MKKKIIIVCSLLLVLILITIVRAILVRTNVLQQKSPEVQHEQTEVNDKSQTGYIIHALGGMNGEDSYINSIDSMQVAYDAGYRYFEADVSFTSDHILVLAHSGENNVWSRNDWELRLGQEYPFEQDDERHLCTYDEFMSFRIQGKYTANSFADLVEFLKSHEDAYVMVDAGHRSYEDTKDYYLAVATTVQRVCVTSEKFEQVMSQLIAGGQTTEMVRAAREVYDFPLINLYYDSDEKREDILKTPEDFVKYCEQEDISSYSVAKEVYTEDVARVLGESSLIGYVFTVNDKDEAEGIWKNGAEFVGTDYLWATDSDVN